MNRLSGILNSFAVVACISVLLGACQKPEEIAREKAVAIIEAEEFVEAEQILAIGTEEFIETEELIETEEVLEIEEVLEVEIPEVPEEIIFDIQEIDGDLQAFMIGKSYHENNHITFADLRLVKVGYNGFDSLEHQGELIVNKAIAEDIKDIFYELYILKYPIEKIELVDYYDGDDDLSMVANNTSAFNYRVIAGTSKLSNHAYGLAVDVNPLINPYVTSYGIFPPEGAEYADRSGDVMGMIQKDDLCYKLFTSRGFIWGGDWTKSKDYQHFDIWLEGINK